MSTLQTDLRLSDHFTLAEMTHSQTAVRSGLDNTPDEVTVQNLRQLVEHVLEPLRLYLGKPVLISSGYRSKAVNAAIGGAASSQHCLGQAADIQVHTLTVANLAQTIRQLGLPYDQLIDEFGDWVHVSYGPRQRREALIARKVNGKTIYTPA